MANPAIVPYRTAAPQLEDPEPNVHVCAECRHSSDAEPTEEFRNKYPLVARSRATCRSSIILKGARRDPILGKPNKITCEKVREVFPGACPGYVPRSDHYEEPPQETAAQLLLEVKFSGRSRARTARLTQSAIVLSILSSALATLTVFLQDPVLGGALVVLGAIFGSTAIAMASALSGTSDTRVPELAEKLNAALKEGDQ